MQVHQAPEVLPGLLEEYCMRRTPHISNQDARRLLLHVHGLSFAPSRKLTVQGLLELVAHLGFVQVDSINTIKRAHHLILFVRNLTYRQGPRTPLPATAR